VISYNLAIGTCEKGQYCEQALCLTHDMRYLRLQPTVISFSFAITACWKGQ